MLTYRCQAIEGGRVFMGATREEALAAFRGAFPSRACVVQLLGRGGLWWDPLLVETWIAYDDARRCLPPAHHPNFDMGR
jgi:hypothetical protein